MLVGRTIRGHFRVDGTAKAAYPDRAAAEASIAGQRAMNAYRCRFCKRWHVGHMR